jgi:hypothetical protein
MRQAAVAKSHYQTDRKDGRDQYGKQQSSPIYFGVPDRAHSALEALAIS